MNAKHILVIEDDKRVAIALSARLRAAGYEVDPAPDPAFGIILATARRPDLIITDIYLPFMQGLAFARRLESFGLKGVPVIFITASHRDGLWESAMSLKAAGYFEKPYDPERLLASVATAVNRPIEHSNSATVRNEPAL